MQNWRRLVLVLLVGALGSSWTAAQPDRTVDLSGFGCDLLIQGAAADDRTGSSVALGDVNGDGIDDLVVGAPLADAPNRPDAGAVYVFLGRRDRPGQLILDLATRSPDVIIRGDGSGDFLGTRVAVGDVNGDGRPDIVTTGWGVDEGTRSNCGGAYVIHGRTTLPAVIDLGTTRADLTIYGRFFFDEMGRSLALGDLNRDGIADIATGAPDADPGGRSNAGKVHVILGSKSYPAQAVIDLVGRLADITVYGRFQFNHLGSSLAFGDFNNDGIGDLVIGARFASKVKVQAGETYVVHGRPTWSPPFILDLGTGGQPDFTVVGRWSHDNLSTSLAVGDVNGDGKNDLLTTAFGSGPGWPGPIRANAGELNVIFGATFPARFVWDLDTTPPDIRVMGRAAGDRLGHGAALADLDGDGVKDVVGAAPEASPLSRVDAGTVFVFRGRSFSTLTLIDLSQSSGDWEIRGAAASELTGQAAVAAGDFNGDGHADLALGVPGATFNARNAAGGVRLVYGGFTFPLDPPRIATRQRLQLTARAFPDTYRLGAAAFSGLVGIPIDAARRLPLDPDVLFFTSLVAPQVFADYQGFLSAGGEATASIRIPDIAGLAGVTVSSAFVLLDQKAPAGTAAVGNRLHLTFVP